MKGLILGHAQHGKSTLARMLEEMYSIVGKDSSLHCAEHVVMPALEKIGVSYGTVEACYNDRFNYRPEWHQAIWHYNRADPTKLAREITAESDLYVGMRKFREFEACIEQSVFTGVMWIHASGVPYESQESFDISYIKAERLCRKHGVPFEKFYFDINDLPYEEACDNLLDQIEKSSFISQFRNYKSRKSTRTG